MIKIPPDLKIWGIFKNLENNKKLRQLKWKQKKLNKKKLEKFMDHS